MSSAVVGSDPRVLGGPRVSHRAPLFTLGFLLALVAFVGVFFLAKAAANATPGSVMVVVAARDLNPRETIPAGALQLTRLPATAAPPGYATHVNQVAGSTAQVRILRGQAVTLNLVTRSPDQINDASATFLPIPQGDVAFTLPTSEQQGVAGYISPGDYIDVVATVNSAVFGASSPKVVTATTLTHVHVIRVGPLGDANKYGQSMGVSSSLTVTVSECEAKVLDWLLANASLRYVLVSYKDYAPASSAPAITCGARGVVTPAQVDGMFGFSKE